MAQEPITHQMTDRDYLILIDDKLTRILERLGDIRRAETDDEKADQQARAKARREAE